MKSLLLQMHLNCVLHTSEKLETSSFMKATRHLQTCARRCSCEEEEDCRKAVSDGQYKVSGEKESACPLPHENQTSKNVHLP